MLHQYPDTDLMNLAAQGNKLAFEVLVQRHLPKAYAIAQRINTPADAEEAVQEAFTKIWVNAAKFDPEKASFTTWMYRIITNSALDIAKKKGQKYSSNDMELIEDPSNTEQDSINAEEAKIVEKAVRSLKKEQKTAIILCYYEGFTNQEAAGIMDMNIKALEGLLFRAREKLKTALKILR